MTGKTDLDLYLRSISNSYSQVFFSDHRGFAVLLLIISFFDPYAGVAGLIAVVSTSTVAFLINLDKSATARGLYGFNSLLTGLGLGVYYYFSMHLIFIIVLAAIFTLFISVSLQGVLGKYNLPYLSFPFIISIWIFFIATSSFTTLNINERGIYTLNEFYAMGGMPLVRLYESFYSLHLPVFIHSFFVSLSAIFFQYNIVAGILIAFGLLLFSRIAFTLACMGFAVAYLFYSFIGVEFSSVDYSYIGFNYILTSIAIGGFFLVPSARSYLSVVILIPLVAVVTLSFSNILHTFHLPVYSLPFSMITLLYLYILKFRVDYSYKLSEVFFQFNSPEKNLYTFQNKRERFRYKHLVPLKLPFFGTWSVSQAHQGEYTHKDQWQHAWDFVILDQQNQQYKNDGNYTQDYFCFNKPVVSPGNGVIEKVTDDIEDNTIGQINLQENWGNTVIIKHADNVYSKLSHLKQNSIIVKEGQRVKYGERIGKCGNSGRSPFPHLHFQIQEHPYIGSATMDYPIANYITHKEGQAEFCSYHKPQKDEKVSNVEVNALLQKAFQFIPGQVLTFSVKGEKTEIKEIKWEVHVNPYNQSYLYCKESNAYAYFENQDSLFFFTQFYGSRKGLLYNFFLGAYKIQKGFYKNMEIADVYPLHQHFPKRYLWIQDFFSPFIIVGRSRFRLSYTHYEESFDTAEISLESSAINSIGRKNLSEKKFSLSITADGISSFIIRNPKNTIILQRCQEP